jgi:adenylate cyclase
VPDGSERASISELSHADLVARLEEAYDQQRAVSAVLRAVVTSQGLQPVLDEIVVAARTLCESDHAQLYLLDKDVFSIRASAEDSDAGYAYAEAHPHPLDRATVVGRAGLAREAVQIPDVLADPEYDFGGQAIAGYRALLGVPIMLDGELIGVIGAGRDVPGPFTPQQVELVKTFADQAAIAIANSRLIDAVERQRAELSRFISPQVAELITSEHGRQLLDGHRAYISCLFCDLRGFTAFAETAAPEELFEVLRAYHELLGELIPAHHGTLEHFAGDGVMVFFNDPLEVAEHELEAVRLALAAREHFAELSGTWQRRGIVLGLGIGIEAGYATLGRIGFEGRYDYGALGPVTNLASRLSTHAEPGQILIGQRLHAAVEEAMETTPVGELELKGFGRPVAAYEVRGVRAST